MVGMAAGKAIFDDMRKRVLYVERGGNKKVLQVCLNMVITGQHSDSTWLRAIADSVLCCTGNPGVGKTTLARLVSRFLHAYGVLPKDTFVEKNGLELKGQYVGQSCPRVVDAVADAMGGCECCSQFGARSPDTVAGKACSSTRHTPSRAAMTLSAWRSSGPCSQRSSFRWVHPGRHREPLPCPGGKQSHQPAGDPRGVQGQDAGPAQCGSGPAAPIPQSGSSLFFPCLLVR